ncbi:MAG: hypothetical protein IH977_02040 [Nitrospinae bacterium]|nr:hypothetical protein [Nitrospinota bacterium]
MSLSGIAPNASITVTTQIAATAFHDRKNQPNPVEQAQGGKNPPNSVEQAQGRKNPPSSVEQTQGPKNQSNSVEQTQPKQLDPISFTGLGPVEDIVTLSSLSKLLSQKTPPDSSLSK